MNVGDDKQSLFKPSADSIMRLALWSLALVPAGGIALLFIFVRSPLHTGQYEPVVQPVPFDHRHHVADSGIDCRYCHTTVDKAATAGFPSSEVCMGCHAQVWNQSALLEPVRASFFAGTPLVWRRVHRLPDYVYFDHSIHVNKGVGCVTCHGRVDQMPEVMQASTLSMKWCLDCHRDPAASLRPQARITDLAWQPNDAKREGALLAAANQVHARISCTACHR